MIIIDLVVCLWIGLSIAAVLLMQFAPLGYCDSKGFHTGEPAQIQSPRLTRFQQFCQTVCLHRVTCNQKVSARAAVSCEPFEMHALRSSALAPLSTADPARRT